MQRGEREEGVKTHRYTVLKGCQERDIVRPPHSPSNYTRVTDRYGVYSHVARNLVGSREKQCGDDGDDLNTAVTSHYRGEAVMRLSSQPYRYQRAIPRDVIDRTSVHRDSGSSDRMSGSAVWKYFTINDDNPHMADCKLCSAKISRGGTKCSTYNTSNIIKHLKLKHKSEHGEFAASSNVSTQQPTQQQTIARREKITRDNPRAKQITEVLTQFIVLTINRFQSLISWDFVALLMFWSRSTRFPVADIVLPQIHDAVKKHVVCTLLKICVKTDSKCVKFLHINGWV